MTAVMAGLGLIIAIGLILAFFRGADILNERGGERDQ
jgi:hypothetical protein